jgi:hypothetical protein
VVDVPEQVRISNQDPSLSELGRKEKDLEPDNNGIPQLRLPFPGISEDASI